MRRRQKIAPTPAAMTTPTATKPRSITGGFAVDEEAGAALCTPPGGAGVVVEAGGAVPGGSGVGEGVGTGSGGAAAAAARASEPGATGPAGVVVPAALAVAGAVAGL